METENNATSVSPGDEQIIVSPEMHDRYSCALFIQHVVLICYCLEWFYNAATLKLQR